VSTGKPSECQSGQQVYFALSPSAGQVKIGVSTNPPNRINEMLVARPDIELLVTISGGRELEKQLHRRFRDFHIAQEWFEYANQIQCFVRERRWEQPDLPPLESRSSKRASGVTKRELAHELNVSIRTDDQWIHDKKIPYRKLSPRLVRFDLDEVEKALSRYTVREVQ
jgi:excisionase family DNA binding protein